MAEAVGLCASIIAIVELTTKAIFFFGDIKDATSDRAKLLKELPNLQGVIVLLKGQLEDPQKPVIWSETIKVILGTDGPLNQIHTLLQKLLKKLEPGEGWKKHTKALKWPLQKRELLEDLETIERCKSLIQLALNNDHANLSRQIHSDVEALQLEVKKIHDYQKMQELRSKKEEDMVILEWLSDLIFWAKQKDTYERRQEGTGLWFLGSKNFIKWRDGNLGNSKRILFCTGMPGAGKTVLASMAINQLEEIISNGPILDGLAYVYCNYQIQNQTAARLIAAILRQLITWLPKIPEEIIELYIRQKQKGLRPSLKELAAQLKRIIPEFRKVFLVIDGLDECPEEAQRDKLLNVLTSLGTTVHILVTAREIRDIQELFENEVHQEIRARDEDVRTYVKAQVAASRQLRTVIRDSRAAKKGSGGAASILDDIVDTIVRKAQGMFLLAQLHINTIAMRATLRGVQRALNELPDKLNSSYDNTMEQIGGYHDLERRQLAILALTWIMHSVGPLSLAELQHALATENDDAYLNDDALPGESIIITLCSGLVTIDHESHHIRFVHYTTQEYFQQNAAKLLPDPHCVLATTCLTYLSFDIFDIGCCQSVDDLQSFMEEFSLLRYAAGSWFVHVRIVEESNSPLVTELTERVLNFLRSTGKLTFTAQVAGKCKGEKSDRHRRPRDLLTAVALGLGSAVKALLADQKSVNSFEVQQTPKHGFTPLHLALRKLYGHEKARMPLLLLNQQPSRQKQGKNGSALASLSLEEFESNRAELVRLLLSQSNVDPNQKDDEGVAPLCMATAMGLPDMVAALLKDDRVDPNTVDDENGGALTYARSRSGSQ